ncbi:MAG: sulfur carrier protein ThiS [Alphaproteobacteria bacterium]
MKIKVNGKTVETQGGTLAALLDELGFSGKKIATAVNEEFVPATKRETHQLADGDRVEIVAPRQGG